MRSASDIGKMQRLFTDIKSHDFKFSVRTVWCVQDETGRNADRKCSTISLHKWNNISYKYKKRKMRC